MQLAVEGAPLNRDIGHLPLRADPLVDDESSQQGERPLAAILLPHLILPLLVDLEAVPHGALGLVDEVLECSFYWLLIVIYGPEFKDALVGELVPEREA